MHTSLKVLLVEDDPNDAKLVLRELKHAGFEVIPQRVDTEAAFLAGLRADLDFILSDFAMPGFNGMRALALLKKSGLDVPFILVSGTVGEDIAVEAMKQGASDYLIKDRLARLGPVVHHALEQARLRKERKLTEEELRLTHEKLRHLLAHSPAVIYTLKIDGQNVTPVVVSDNIERLLGFAVQESCHYGWWVQHLHPDDRERVLKALAQALAQNGYSIEYRIRHKDGTYRWIEDNNRLLRDVDGKPDVMVGVWSDISDRKRADEELHDQLHELQRWHEVILGREERILELKSEVNELLAIHNQPARYSNTPTP